MMKTRLDTKLVQLGLVSGRDKAKAIIMAGIVYVNGQKADKAGTEVLDEDKIELRGETLRYVSRGGLKLEKAFESFPIQVQNAICMDIGASTGGFTDCMLQNGAKKVYAIDWGYELLLNDEVPENIGYIGIRSHNILVSEDNSSDNVFTFQISDILDNPFDITVSLSSPISTGNINIKLKKENFTLKIGSIIKLTFPKEHIFFF